MNAPEPDIREMIDRARQGDRQALGDLLDIHRAYLRILTERQLDRRLGTRLDASDLIQQTFLSVFRDFARFDGSEEGQFLGWLKHIHERNLQDAVRDHVYTQKRAVGKETSIEGGADASIDSITSPSQRAMLGEDAVRLAQAMDELPKGQRKAVRLRHLEGWSLDAIAEQIERSPEATAGLIKRGVQSLRKKLQRPPVG